MQGVIVQQQQHPSVQFGALNGVGPPGTNSPGMPTDDDFGGITRRSRMSQALGVRTTRLLGVAFLISGLAMVVLQIICTAIIYDRNITRGNIHEIGGGIWCGIPVFICGILGTCAAKHKTKGLVISFLVFDALSVGLFAPLMIGFTGGDISADYSGQFCSYIYNSDYDYGYGAGILPDIRWNCDYKKILVALTWLLLIDALFIFGISILGIITNSVALKKAKGCCRCNESSNVQPPIIIYVPVNQMPVVIGQPSQYVAAPGRVDPPQPQSVFQVPSDQPHEVSAVAAASSPAPTYTAAAAAASANPAGTISEPPPYKEKV
jgi:hypothetical protein